MLFVRSSQFKKHYKKLSKKERSKVAERLSLMAKDEFNPILNNHKLHGDFSACRSINITSDIRLVYSVKDGVCLLLAVGTHSKLYE